MNLSAALDALDDLAARADTYEDRHAHPDRAARQAYLDALEDMRERLLELDEQAALAA